MLKLEVSPKTPKAIVLSCSLIVPYNEAMSLNCANWAQGNEKQQAAARRQLARTRKNIKQDSPERFKAILKTVQNADDKQFQFDCFGSGGKAKDMAFMAIMKAYNDKHPDSPITKQTLIDAIKKITPAGYKTSKRLEKNLMFPTKYDDMWAHEWHIPLSAIFPKDTENYEYEWGDQVYIKLVFTSEPKPNGNFDPNADILIPSFHRDSDSEMFDRTTGKATSWWSDDAGNPEEKQSMIEEGNLAKKSMPGFEE